MSEFFKEVLGIYKEKTKLPIVSTYLIILIVWNWDILSIYLFSDKNIETRIEDIKSIASNDLSHFLRIFWPIIIATVYSFTSEFLMRWIDAGLNSTRKERRIYKNDAAIDLATSKYLISQAESGQRDLDELNRQIEESNNQRDILSKRLQENEDFYKKEISKLQDELKVSRIIINTPTLDEQVQTLGEKIEFDELYTLIKNLNDVFVNTFISNLQIDDTFGIEEIPKFELRNTLMDANIIKKFNNDNNYYYVTHKGARFAKYFNRISKERRN